MTQGISAPHRPHHGATDVWLTPPAIIAALGWFDLDPCAAPDWPTAEYHFYEDGLTRTWFGRVWLNPPYGPETGKWLAKLAAHGDGIAIVFARTETRMFFDHVWEKASALLFIRGRLHFHRADGIRAKANAGGPTVLVAYGAANAETLRTCGIDGAFVPLPAATDAKGATK